MNSSSENKSSKNKKDMIAQTLLSCENQDETVAKVLKMKQTLDKSHEHSEWVLSESLSKLKHMVKSVNILKVTGVGITVNALRKHPSTHVAKISTTLVNEWKSMMKGWMKDSENMQQQKGGESKTTIPKNPPQIEKQLIVPASNEKQSLIVRIKLKKVEPKDSVTPEQKVENENDDSAARVLRIKGILDEAIRDEFIGESAVLESLMKLLEMNLSVKTLRETGIARSVRDLQTRRSKDVRQIAWALVEGWRGIVEEYVKKEFSLEELKTRMKELIQGKLKATKRKLKEPYEEAETMKKKRRIKVIRVSCTEKEY